MRNQAIDIAKGITIILMVVGHASCPEGLYKLIYSFHMPLFYILSGYFLTEDSLANTRSFVLKKWKKLALPLLICGFISLLLHNVCIHCGILNECYGTRTGDVSHWFGMKDYLVRLGLLVGFLEVYDDPFLGACWFIQCMFFAYVGIAILHKLFRKIAWQKQCIIGMGIFFGLSLLLTGMHWLIPGLKTIFVTRICMAGVFIYLGLFLRHFIDQWNVRWWQLCLLALPACLAIYSPFAISMSEQINPIQYILLLITSTTGTLCMYGISKYISQLKRSSVMLQTVGMYSIYILFLHILMFKPISYLFIKIYHLDPLWIGCRPTIYMIANSWHWIIYTIGSITLCLIIAFISRKIKLHGTGLHHNAHV